jgi:hypothetical protein
VSASAATIFTLYIFSLKVTGYAAGNWNKAGRKSDVRKNYRFLTPTTSTHENHIHATIPKANNFKTLKEAQSSHSTSDVKL